MKLLHRSGVCALALMAGTAAMQFEPTVLRDIAFGNEAQHITVGAVKTSLWSAALAQAADSVVLENVNLTFGTASYELRRIELSGVTSSRADIEAILSSSSSEPMARRLARINAKQVTIPEAKVTERTGPTTQAITYRNIVITDIVAGRAASTAIETLGGEISHPEGTGLVSTGRITINDLDTQALANFYEAAADSTSTLTRIYGSFAVDNLTYNDNKEGVVFSIARLSGRDFRGRPTKDSWVRSSARINELGEKQKLTSEETGQLFELVADILTAFDIGQVEASGIEIKTPASTDASAATGRIARMTYTGSTGQQPADFRMEDLDVGGQDGRVKLGTMSLTGFSIAPTLEGFKTLKGKPLEDLGTSSLRALIPTLGTLRLSGLDIDATSKGEDDDKPERTQLTLESLEITADKPLNGIPTNIKIEHRNAAMALPPNSTDDFIQELLALGYKSFNSSMALAAIWNEAANEIALTDVSFQGQDMGSLRLTGLIGNVSPDLFSLDEATASTALIGAKAKSANVVVENWGLVERYLAKAAKEEGTTPEALQKMYSGAAPLVLSSMIGNSEQAKALGQAITRFIEKPGKLTIDAQTKNPSGFGVMDVMLTSDPKRLLEKLKITAKAE